MSKCTFTSVERKIYTLYSLLCYLLMLLMQPAEAPSGECGCVSNLALTNSLRCVSGITGSVSYRETLRAVFSNRSILDVQ